MRIVQQWALIKFQQESSAFKIRSTKSEIRNKAQNSNFLNQFRILVIGVFEPQQRAHFPPLAAGLASES
jgi:hypothetical protein